MRGHRAEPLEPGTRRSPSCWPSSRAPAAEAHAGGAPGPLGDELVEGDAERRRAMAEVLEGRPMPALDVAGWSNARHLRDGRQMPEGTKLVVLTFLASGDAAAVERLAAPAPGAGPTRGVIVIGVLTDESVGEARKALRSGRDRVPPPPSTAGGPGGGRRTGPTDGEPETYLIHPNGTVLAGATWPRRSSTRRSRRRSGRFSFRVAAVLAPRSGSGGVPRRRGARCKQRGLPCPTLPPMPDRDAVRRTTADRLRGGQHGQPDVPESGSTGSSTKSGGVVETRASAREFTAVPHHRPIGGEGSRRAAGKSSKLRGRRPSSASSAANGPIMANAPGRVRAWT